MAYTPVQKCQQPVFTCAKAIMETPEQQTKSVQS